MPSPRHKHLRRLDEIWLDASIYFITTCTASRRPILANETAATILREEFAGATDRYGWLVGRFVIMPDHVHFFCATGGESEPKTLASFMNGFKQWSAKRMAKTMEVTPPIWQAEFFDRVLRTHESYNGKWRYVIDTPVRAGLVREAEAWPYAGEIHPL